MSHLRSFDGWDPSVTAELVVSGLDIYFEKPKDDTLRDLSKLAEMLGRYSGDPALGMEWTRATFRLVGRDNRDLVRASGRL